MMGARSRAYIPHDLGNMGAIGWVMRSREIIHRPRGDNPTPKTLVWDPTPKFSILGVGRAKSRKIDSKVGVGRVLLSAEHEAAPFYTRHKSLLVAT